MGGKLATALPQAFSHITRYPLGWPGGVSSWGADVGGLLHVTARLPTALAALGIYQLLWAGGHKYINTAGTWAGS